MDTIRILVADDHPIVRTGLRALLGSQLGMEVVGEADDGPSAVQRVLELRPDVVVMDISMDGTQGLAATREIRRRVPETKVLILTIHDNEEYVRRALELGATGYVLKQSVDTELVVAIRAVARGDIFIYPSFARVLLRDLGAAEKDRDVAQGDRYTSLSPREEQVLLRVALGCTNRQIAHELCLSIKTVETYRARLMEKLSLRSRTALVRYALSRGLLDEEANPELTRRDSVLGSSEAA